MARWENRDASIIPLRVTQGMKPLNIGDCVLCSAVASLQYDENDRRLVHAQPCKKFEAVITGKQRKQLGTYHAGSQQPYNYLTDGDYTPPCLSHDKTVILWEVRISWLNKPLLVRDEDLEPSLPFVLPLTRMKVEHVYEETAVA